MQVCGKPQSKKSGAPFYAALAANLVSPLPYSIASHRSEAVRDAIKRLAKSGNVDVFQFETLGYGDALLGTNARTIITAHNVESLIWERLYQSERQPVKRWFIRQQFEKYRRYERDVLQHASQVVAVSHEDASLLETEFGVADVAVVDNGVDVKYYASAAAKRDPHPKQILFLGSLDWRPNLDAIDILLTDVLPRVRAEEPDARLVIVGRSPSASLVRRVGHMENVELHADVPDVRPYLAKSAVMAVPLRIGGGSRLKILEAIASDVPVVSTAIGCEGLIFKAGRDLFVADGTDTMASALVDAMRNPARSKVMVARGREVIDSHYDWGRLADRLEQVWLGVSSVR